MKLRPVNEQKWEPQGAGSLAESVEKKWNLAVNLRPGTKRTYFSKLKCHILPALGPIQLDKLGTHSIEKLLKEKRDAKYSGAHVRAIWAVLSRVLRDALRWKDLESNPAKGIRLDPAEPIRPTNRIDESQIRKLAVVLPEPCSTIVLLLALTGLRIGELLGLRWENVDFARQTVAVEATATEAELDRPRHTPAGG